MTWHTQSLSFSSEIVARIFYFLLFCRVPFCVLLCRTCHLAMNARKQPNEQQMERSSVQTSRKLWKMQWDPVRRTVWFINNLFEISHKWLLLFSPLLLIFFSLRLFLLLYCGHGHVVYSYTYLRLGQDLYVLRVRLPHIGQTPKIKTKM